jgi:hemolysin III
MNDPIAPLTRPRLRGVFHLYAFILSLAVGGLLIVETADGQRRVAAAIYAVAVAVMFGASAFHHRITWTPRQRRWTRRLDHAAIYLMIAGSYTPFALLVLTGSWRPVILALVWAGALAATALKLVWVEAPKWLAAALGIALGWIGVVILPQILHRVGAIGGVLLFVGGSLYTIGGIVYARRRPDPIPSTFGYHELFHVLVVAAVAAQYTAIAVFVLQAT